MPSTLLLRPRQIDQPVRVETAPDLSAELERDADGVPRRAQRVRDRGDVNVSADGSETVLCDSRLLGPDGGVRRARRIRRRSSASCELPPIELAPGETCAELCDSSLAAHRSAMQHAVVLLSSTQREEKLYGPSDVQHDHRSIEDCASRSPQCCDDRAVHHLVRENVWHTLVARQVRVQLEGQPVDVEAHLGMGEEKTGHARLEIAFADKAPWSEDVGDDPDGEAARFHGSTSLCPSSVRAVCA